MKGTKRTGESVLAAYQESFAETWADNTPAETVRFVVLDCETTGFDRERDRIVSIGAIAMTNAEIVLGDSFETLLRVRYNTAATLVHGITRAEARFGMEERDALLQFLDYLRDGVIVGHHIAHDLGMLNAACKRHFNMVLRNRHIDTLGLTLHLEHDRGCADAVPGRSASLDALCERFGIVPYDRHTAAGDAFLTAQIFLRLIRYSRHCGRDSLATLSEPFWAPDTDTGE
jgi:DNA polymerase-3 subunit epsilon